MHLQIPPKQTSEQRVDAVGALMMHLALLLYVVCTRLVAGSSASSMCYRSNIKGCVHPVILCADFHCISAPKVLCIAAGIDVATKLVYAKDAHVLYVYGGTHET